MNIQTVKQGAKITLLNGIYMILFGVFYIVFIKYNMKTNFKALDPDNLWGFFEKFNPEIAYMFSLFNIIMGIFLISSGIAVIYLSYFLIKRKEKITWVVLFILGMIGWGGLLAISFLFKNRLLMTLSFIGWLSFIAGMVVPLKFYLQKGYKKY